MYVRTPESPNQPIRALVRELGKFEICGGPDYGKPYLHFDIAHTLFHSFSMNYEDNSDELYSLNQPYSKRPCGDGRSGLVLSAKLKDCWQEFTNTDFCQQKNGVLVSDIYFHHSILLPSL